MNTDNILQIIEFLMIIFSFILILIVILQPSQRTGLIGDATDSEKRVKRGFELFLFRSTIFSVFCFIFLSVLYMAIGAGLFTYI